jgi:hypothetical protein
LIYFKVVLNICWHLWPYCPPTFYYLARSWAVQRRGLLKSTHGVSGLSVGLCGALSDYDESGFAGLPRGASASQQDTSVIHDVDIYPVVGILFMLFAVPLGMSWAEPGQTNSESFCGPFSGHLEGPPSGPHPAPLKLNVAGRPEGPGEAPGGRFCAPSSPQGPPKSRNPVCRHCWSPEGSLSRGPDSDLRREIVFWQVLVGVFRACSGCSRVGELTSAE